MLISHRRALIPCIIVAALLIGADGPTTKPDPSMMKPSGDGWISLIGKDLTGWTVQPQYWKIDEPGVLHGRTPGEQEHHYIYTEKSYDDFELHAEMKLIGNNSGICIRIAPKSFDNVPGYQVDMGDGYWGCLWEEHGRGKVVDFGKEYADKLVRKDDWNHYYIRAKGHHIEAWLNGVKTVDVVDDKGLLSGPIGFQLCHGVGRVTDVTFKNVMYRPLK